MEGVTKQSLSSERNSLIFCQQGKTCLQFWINSWTSCFSSRAAQYLIIPPVKICRPLSACHISITQQLTHNATLTQAEKGQNQHNRASLTDSPSRHKALILHVFSLSNFLPSPHVNVPCVCPLSKKICIFGRRERPTVHSIQKGFFSPKIRKGFQRN